MFSSFRAVLSSLAIVNFRLLGDLVSMVIEWNMFHPPVFAVTPESPHETVPGCHHSLSDPKRPVSTSD